jgi:hypothetical protein
MNLREQFENRPVGSIIVMAILVVIGAWATLNELLVRPRDEELARLERRLNELKDRASTASWAHDPAAIGRNEEEPNSSLTTRSTPISPEAEIGKEGSGVLLRTGAAGDAPESKQRIPVPQAQGFQTESYFLRIENIRRRGATVEVDLLLESHKSEAFRFALSEPYMLDSQGTRLDILRDDSGGLVGRGIEVLPYTKLRGSLSFCVMTKPSTIRVGGFSGSEPACTGESVDGGKFTLAADEVFPQTRRKVILRSAEAGEYG